MRRLHPRPVQARLSGPSRKKRRADTAIVEIALDSAERTVAIEQLRVIPTLFVRSVIAGEEHKRILLDPKFAQFRENRSDVTVELSYHSGEVTIRLRPWLVSVRIIARESIPLPVCFVNSLLA